MVLEIFTFGQADVHRGQYSNDIYPCGGISDHRRITIHCARYGILPLKLIAGEFYLKSLKVMVSSFLIPCLAYILR